MQYPKITLVISLIVCTSILFLRCIQDPSNDDLRGNPFAGSATCVKCHQDIAGSYAHTNHFKTSSKVDDNTLSKFIADNNSTFYYNDSGYVQLEKEGDAFFQSSFKEGKKVFSRKFDIAFGSAEKAQTYGYWNEQEAFQLPLTYFSSKNVWANSPGFPVSHAYFGRVIEARCFECHASYLDKKIVQSGPLKVSEKIDEKSIIFGIDCERCHGPALEHVRYQEDHPDVKTSKYIASIKSLTRMQQLDVCGACHSGNDYEIERSLFGFRPGDTLSYFYNPYFGARKSEPDVHGKQVQLLQASMCFQKSEMTCNSCHNAHEPEENKTTQFIAKCMDCHKESDHAVTMFEKETTSLPGGDQVLKANCIDCHMPLQESKVIYFSGNKEEKKMPYLLRTHKIGIY